MSWLNGGRYALNDDESETIIRHPVGRRAAGAIQAPADTTKASGLLRPCFRPANVAGGLFAHHPKLTGYPPVPAYSASLGD
jgi:hypothetical protein